MEIHDRLQAFWDNRAPDIIPYTIYHNEWKNVKHDPAWKAMMDAGLGITMHVPSAQVTYEGVDATHDEYVENGKTIRRITWSCPAGELVEESADWWPRQHMLKGAKDYAVMTWIVQRARVEPNPEGFDRAMVEMGPAGVPLAFPGRSPFQRILVDWAGMEEFSYHLAECPDEVDELHDALMAHMLEVITVTAEGPGKYVAVLDNFTAEAVGPARFARYHMPFYHDIAPMLHQAGKIIGVHYDGRTAAVADMIREAPFDALESLTNPHEGDVTIGEARRQWPDKLIWCNIRVGDYQLPPDQLREHVAELVQTGSTGGAGFALEVSEDIPDNWRQSMPTVLQTLQEMKLG